MNDPGRARCGSYEIVAQRAGSLTIRPDGTVELFAEDPYLVKVQGDGDRDALREALAIPAGASEGILRFGNFIGRAELGGRPLLVRSHRLQPAAVEEMLDEVCSWLSTLPFGAGTPVHVAYSRRREAGPEVLYHDFALLRDAFRDNGPHSLTEAVERILARPHETLGADLPQRVPIWGASRIEAETLSSIPTRPELLNRIPAGSPLGRTALAKKLGGWMPESVEIRPPLHTTDNRENRFVCGVLETMIDLLRRFERIARAESRASAALNMGEAREIADYLRRCRRHPALAQVQPLYEMPLHSTVLRSRPGYRQLLHLRAELLGRSRVDAHDARRLLESRDAAAIYEYWCYIRIVGELEGVLGQPLTVDRFKASPLRAGLSNGYRVGWGEVEAVYNASFSRPAAGDPRPGFDSYSLRLRPDIVLRGADGRLNLFDAKLKRRFAQALDENEPGPSPEDSFKPEDLHKMHAYRDALGADSAWVLYPGGSAEPEQFPAPPGGEAPAGFQGVGAISLTPGASHDGGLRELLSDLAQSDLPSAR